MFLFEAVVFLYIHPEHVAIVISVLDIHHPYSHLEVLVIRCNVTLWIITHVARPHTHYMHNMYEPYHIPVCCHTNSIMFMCVCHCDIEPCAMYMCSFFMISTRSIISFNYSHESHILEIHCHVICDDTHTLFQHVSDDHST